MPHVPAPSWASTIILSTPAKNGQDMPLNVLVGVEINGKVEQRPCVLLRRYLRWERAGSGEWHLSGAPQMGR